MTPDDVLNNSDGPDHAEQAAPQDGTPEVDAAEPAFPPRPPQPDPVDLGSLYRAEPWDKRSLLVHLVSTAPEGMVLVFVRSRFRGARLAQGLSHQGMPSAILHGERNPRVRRKLLERFVGEKVRILVVTESGLRGLPEPDACLVVQFDLPHQAATILERRRLYPVPAFVSMATTQDDPLLVELAAMTPLVLQEMPWPEGCLKGTPPPAGDARPEREEEGASAASPPPPPRRDPPPKEGPRPQDPRLTKREKRKLRMQRRKERKRLERERDPGADQVRFLRRYDDPPGDELQEGAPRLPFGRASRPSLRVIARPYEGPPLYGALEPVEEKPEINGNVAMAVEVRPLPPDDLGNRCHRHEEPSSAPFFRSPARIVSSWRRSVADPMLPQPSPLDPPKPVGVLTISMSTPFSPGGKPVRRKPQRRHHGSGGGRRRRHRPRR